MRTAFTRRRRSLKAVQFISAGARAIAAAIRIIDAPGERLNSIKPYNARPKENCMEREELERIVREHANVADVDPIENYLGAIATEPAVPDFAMAMCTIRMEESAPYLRAVPVRAADGEVLSKEAGTLLFRGLHILGAARYRSLPASAALAAPPV
jgi:hypothetical protein